MVLDEIIGAAVSAAVTVLLTAVLPTKCCAWPESVKTPSTDRKVDANKSEAENAHCVSDGNADEEVQANADNELQAKIAQLQVAREMAEVEAQLERDASRLVALGVTRERALQLVRLHGALEAAKDAIIAVAEEEGDIAPLVALARGGTDEQMEGAARALRNLAYNDADNQVAIARAGGIAPLVALARGGTDRQKEEAAWTLAVLACYADNRVAIRKEAGIAPLVALARDGTDGQKQYAAAALAILAYDPMMDNQTAIASAGGIAPLVALARGGTDRQKTAAAAALGHLANGNQYNKVAIVWAGGIAPLVALARDGTDEQKRWAGGALFIFAIAIIGLQLGEPGDDQLGALAGGP